MTSPELRLWALTSSLKGESVAGLQNKRDKFFVIISSQRTKSNPSIQWTATIITGTEGLDHSAPDKWSSPPPADYIFRVATWRHPGH